MYTSRKIPVFLRFQDEEKRAALYFSGIYPPDGDTFNTVTAARAKTGTANPVMIKKTPPKRCFQSDSCQVTGASAFISTDISFRQTVTCA